MTKEERAAKWDADFLPCKKHPHRRCSRSDYIRNNSYRCWQCKQGNRYNRDKRYRQSEKGKEAARRHFKSEKGKDSQKRYNKSERRKDVWCRYDKSAKGQARRAWYIERKLHG